MKHLIVFCMLFLGITFNQLQAQIITGKVYHENQDEVIVAATIFNKNLQIIHQSNIDGSYRISAREGDTLIFSAIGFLPDTQYVQYHMLNGGLDISLVQQVAVLPLVKVTSNYNLDSLQRRIDYQDIYKMPGITGGNRPTDGFGISLSPFSYFSKAGKQKRELKKKIIKQEQEYFIDNCFPQPWVKQLTGLDDKDLKLFMYRYRPSYQFCRKTNRDGMIMYISEKLKEFRLQQ